MGYISYLVVPLKTMKCYNCGGKMEDSVSLITYRGKTIPQNTSKCKSCGKSYVDADEYERIRKELYL